MVENKITEYQTNGFTVSIGERNWIHANPWILPLIVDYSIMKVDLMSGRPNLGILGNWIRSTQLDNNFSKTLFERYWLGLGNYWLTDTEFQDICNQKTLDTPSDEIIDFIGEPCHKYVYSWYNSSKYALALGRASLYIRISDSSPIGFYDYYDFDPKTWPGNRTLTNELKTRGINYFSPSTAKGFDIVYP